MSFLQDRLNNANKTTNNSSAPKTQTDSNDFIAGRLGEIKRIEREPIERARANMPSLVQFNQNLQSKISQPAATPTPTQTRPLPTMTARRIDETPSMTSSNGATIPLVPIVKSNADLRKEWVDERVADESNAPGLFGKIGSAIEPFNRQLFNAIAYTAPLAKGLGRGISLKNNDFLGADYNESTGTKLLETLGTIAAPIVAPGNSLGGYGSTIMNIGQNTAAYGAKLSPRLAGRGAQRAVEGSAAGAIEGAYSGTLEGLTPAEMAWNIGGGAAFGGALDFGLGAAGDYLSATRRANQTPIVNENGMTPTDLNVQSARNRINNDLIPIRTNVPATREVELLTPISNNTPQRMTLDNNTLENIRQSRNEVLEIDNMIKSLESDYQNAIEEEYNWLNESLKNRQGKENGFINFDSDGNFITKVGFISKNPEWYQKFYKEKNKVPNKKELMELAKKRVDEGFTDGPDTVPGWKSMNDYDGNLKSLQDVKKTIEDSIMELENPSSLELPIRNLPEAEQQLGINPSQRNAKFTNPEDTRSHIRSRTERDPFDPKLLAERSYIQAVDDIQRINSFDKAVEKNLGIKLSPSQRSYYKALNARGSDMISNHVLTERMVDKEGNVIGQSLRSVLSQIPSGRINETNFKDYLLAKHAITRMGRGENVFHKDTGLIVEQIDPNKAPKTPKEINEYNMKVEKNKNAIEKVNQKVQQYEKNYPQFKNISNELYEWNRQLGQAWLVNTGQIPQKVFDSWMQENPFYVPNKRSFTTKERRQGMGQGSSGKFANNSKSVKEYSKFGSKSRDIIDPIEAMIENADIYIKTAKRNEVMQVIIDQLEKNPSLDDWGRIVKKEKVDLKDRNIEDVLMESDDSLNKRNWKKGDGEKSNVVSAFKNGERVFVEIEDIDFLDALANLDNQGQNAVIEAARKVTGVFKNLTTGSNPIFGITRNLVRDIPEAYIFSKTVKNPIRYAWDMLEGFVSVFSDGANQAIDNSRNLQKVTPDSFRRWLSGRAELYKNYKSIGGGHSSSVSADRNLLQQSKNAVLPQNAFKRSPARTTFQKGMAGLENLNNALESAPRLGEFKRVLKRGGSIDEALFTAQDVTVNFKRRGKAVKDFDAIIPYLNASVQGLDKLGRQGKDAAPSTIAKALAVISVPTIALFAANYDDPDYEKLSNYQKDNFYMIPNGDGTFTKIAKPRELGVGFSTALERAMRAWANDDPDAWKGFADTARTMFAPPVIGDLIEGKNPLRSTIGGPLIEIDANENFAGSPIIPQYLDGEGSERYKYDANTSEIGKWVGDKLNTSPKNVDHLINAYTGVIGDLILPATTNVGGTGRPVADAFKNIKDTLVKQVTVDPRMSTDASKNFYELKDDLNRIETDFKKGDITIEEVPTWYNDSFRTAMDDVSSTMSDYTKAIREIDKNKDMSKNEKKELRLELTDERNALARNAYEAIRDAIRASE